MHQSTFHAHLAEHQAIKIPLLIPLLFSSAWTFWPSQMEKLFTSCQPMDQGWISNTCTQEVNQNRWLVCHSQRSRVSQPHLVHNRSIKERKWKKKFVRANNKHKLRILSQPEKQLSPWKISLQLDQTVNCWSLLCMRTNWFRQWWARQGFWLFHQLLQLLIWCRLADYNNLPESWLIIWCY